MTAPLSYEATPCGWMHCKHARSEHASGACAVLVVDYSERRFDAQGNRLPPREVPCGCSWVEPVVVTPRLPREVAEEARFAHAEGRPEVRR